MKIRDKLLLGFSLYIFLAVVFGALAYRELRTIGMRLALVEKADDITNSLLEVRRYEKNYLLYKDELSFSNLKKYLDIFKEDIDNITSDIASQIGTENSDVIRHFTAEYERLADLLARDIATQTQLEAQVRESGRKAERLLGGAGLQTFLVLRRYEKNIMLYRTGEAYHVFEKALKTSSLRKHAFIAGYADLVGKLYGQYQDEQNSIELMRQTARKLQSVTENLAKEERTTIDRLLMHAAVLLIAAQIVVIAVGSIVNIKIATSIANPIRRLEKISKQVAAGDFSERIEVKGEDELASLEAAFNHMEEKLQNALWSLEHAVGKLREKQAQLVEAEKLAAVGKLAAGIAHEINNPLTSVLTFSNLMLEQCPAEDKNRERLKLMVRETERARNIVRQLLNFGREIIIKPERISINRPVAEIVDSLKAQQAFQGIALAMNLKEPLPEVHADPAQIGQVVLNMLLNAIHAVTPPGSIEIATRANGRFVELVVSDSGKGIPPENLNKIFDPFFTTKEMTKGTGLGLAVSYGIIKKHGGDIEVASVEGKGTTFTVKLPVTTAGSSQSIDALKV